MTQFNSLNIVDDTVSLNQSCDRMVVLLSLLSLDLVPLHELLQSTTKVKQKEKL